MLKIAVSPCPNDMFVFLGWFLGKTKAKSLCQLSINDVETLNRNVLAKKTLVSKISLAVYPFVKDSYRLLEVGQAFSYKSGPFLFAQKKNHLVKPKLIALPGKNTTAAFLARYFYPDCEYKYCHFSQVLPLLLNQKVDHGVIIHELDDNSYADFLAVKEDLGALWTRSFNQLLPLGGLVIRNDLSKKIESLITKEIRNSITWADKNRSFLEDHILKYSQEKSPQAIWRHIDKFVTEDTFCPSDVAKKSVAKWLEFVEGSF